MLQSSTRGQRVAKRAAGGVTYLHGDHLGSVGKTSGYTDTAQLYEAYGAKRGASEVDTPYRYTGQRWEENDALDIYYYKARWYDPALGRFLQPDPFVPETGNPQNLNRYSYCLGNPLRFIDPTGLFTEKELLAYGVSPDTIKTWKDDPAWWGLISEAQFGDMVTAEHQEWDGFGFVQAVFAALRHTLPGHPIEFTDLILSGYNGNLEDFRQATRGRTLWRSADGTWQEPGFATQFWVPLGPVIGYREAVVYHPERVDWIAVGLDAATIATLGAAGMARSAYALSQLSKASDIVSGVQMGRSAAAIVMGDPADQAYNALQVVLGGATVYFPYPWVQWPAAIVSLGVDLREFKEIRQVPIYE